MSHRLEIALKPELFDAEGEGVRKKAKNYFGFEIDEVRTVNIIIIDADLSSEQLETVQNEIFTNPVTEVSSFEPLDIDFDWTIWVGYRPGVRDNPGSTAVEAIEDILEIKLNKDEAVYTSRRYCVKASNLTEKDADKIAGELLANDIIQQIKIFKKDGWDPKTGIGYIIPKVKLDHTPTVAYIPIESDKALQKISDRRNLALNPNDIPIIR
ncbi:MAG: phosphoribosylformylglycinamidine synthase, partial [Deltaproteobacteria bacterium]|nr:phosphoribosylformylglycinamidine synthase [Deltaproteobacteria bacterium]